MTTTTTRPLVRIGTIVRGHAGQPDCVTAVHYDYPTASSVFGPNRPRRERHVGPVWRSTEPGQRPQYWASEADAVATGHAVDQPARRELTAEEGAAYAATFVSPDMRSVHVETWDADPAPIATDLSAWED